MLRAIFFLVVCVWSVISVGKTLVVTDDTHSIAIGQGIEYLEDPGGVIDFQTISQNQQLWQLNEQDIFNKGFNTSIWWLRFKLKNKTTHDLDRRLEISYALLDYLDLYQRSQDGSVSKLSLGDKLPFHQRPIKHRFFHVPLQLLAGETLELVLRVKTNSSVQVPMTLWERESLSTYDSNRTIIQGIYFGVMFVIVIFNLLMLGVWRDITYLWYAGYVVCMPLFLASLTGQAYRYLWPEASLWNDQALLFFLAGVVGFSGLFIRRMLNLATLSNIWDKLFLALMIAGVLSASSAFIFDYHLAIQLLAFLVIIAAVSAITVGTYAWRKGQSSAGYFIFAWIFLLTGALIMALSKYGVLPVNVFTEYAAQLGSALEVILLTFALAERMNAEKQLRFNAQAETLKVQLKVNDELEFRVEKRTSELQIANQKLQTISETDQLTGIHNRRYLDAILAKEWRRCQRYGHDLAILMIDIDHFKVVNDTHGHLVGDDCLVEIAQRLQKCLRWPSDQLARYGGEEFCILLPETDREGASCVADRVCRVIFDHPIKTKALELNISVSVGISIGIPNENEDMQERINQADNALYAAKNAGRNQWKLL